jgi:hypothetical protein
MRESYRACLRLSDGPSLGLRYLGARREEQGNRRIKGGFPKSHH